MSVLLHLFGVFFITCYLFCLKVISNLLIFLSLSLAIHPFLRIYFFKHFRSELKELFIGSFSFFRRNNWLINLANNFIQKFHDEVIVVSTFPIGKKDIRILKIVVLLGLSLIKIFHLTVKEFININ
jgi:hypothetical protein